MNPPGMKNQTLMLVDRESEKTKWVDALNELHRILRRSKLPQRAVSGLQCVFVCCGAFLIDKIVFRNLQAFQAKEILDNTLSIIKNALSAVIIGWYS